MGLGDFLPSIGGLIVAIIIDVGVIHPIFDSLYGTCVNQATTDMAKNLCNSWYSWAILSYALIGFAGFFGPFIAKK